jgi:hypothetical protein
MLYDNAQLVSLYLDAHLVSQPQTPDAQSQTLFSDTVRSTIGYVLRDMTHADGGFYSAEDADSEGHEGKFYCWTRQELAELLSPEEFNVVVAHFGITADGNFVDHSHPSPLPGQNVLSVVNPVPAADAPLLAAARTKMITARTLRVRPHLDDKVLASWNGLMLGAMARAYAVLGDAAYGEAAERNLCFLQQHLWEAETKTLYHRWREGERDSVQLLDAYAFLLWGVVELYQATLKSAHLTDAVELAEALLARFHDAEGGGFWQSPAGSNDLILRVKDDVDGAEPAGNSVATLALLRLAAITGRTDFRQAAEGALRAGQGKFKRAPHAVPCLLQALDLSLAAGERLVITGDPDSPAVRSLIQAAHSVYRPNLVLAGAAGPVDHASASEGAAAFLCAGQTCRAPVRTAAELVALLAT